ncbi:MAG: peptidylprolyl isomerase [Rhodobacteraceae bacterium]|nr:peptidylprolyl isomerase [Paracoccaceae bacterium]
MSKVKSGDTVRIHYTGTLLDGTQFDSSLERDPLEFTVGSGHVISGLDVALPGMITGEKKTVKAPCQEAYGPINPALCQAVPRDTIPPEVELQLGMQLQMQTEQGQGVLVKVVSFDEQEVTLDANHALAGLDLTFKIELVSFDPI